MKKQKTATRKAQVKNLAPRKSPRGGRKTIADRIAANHNEVILYA